jgi:hypothetical protein
MITINIKPVHYYFYNQIPNHDWEMAILTDDNQLLHSPVTCKDYLQDMLWCENMKKNGSVYGLIWEPGFFDITKPRFRLAILGGDFEMRSRVPFLQEFLNYFDDAQGIERSIVTETDKDNQLVIEFDNAWTLCGPMMSAFTTLVRISGAYMGGDPMDFLKEMDKLRQNNKHVIPAYSNVDVYRLVNTLKKLAALLAGKKAFLPWDKIDSANSAHMMGIMGWSKFPSVDV